MTADTLSVAERLKLMGCVRNKRIGPELAVRKVLHAVGYQGGLEPLPIMLDRMHRI